MIDPAKREAFRGVLQRMIDDGADEATISDATAKFKAKYDAAEPESTPPPTPGFMDRFRASPIKTAIFAPADLAMAVGPPALKFAGNVAQSLSTGPINAVAQAIQDEEGVGPVAWQAAKNVVKSTLNPIMPGPNPIQSSETTLERAGVSNTPQEIETQIPGFVMKSRARASEGGMSPADESRFEDGKMYPQTMTQPGMANQLGFIADNTIPAFAGLAEIKAAGAASRAALDAMVSGRSALAKSFQPAAEKAILGNYRKQLRAEFLPDNPTEGTLKNFPRELSKTLKENDLLRPPEQAKINLNAGLEKYGKAIGETVKKATDADVSVNVQDVINNFATDTRSALTKTGKGAGEIKGIEEKILPQIQDIINNLGPDELGNIPLDKSVEFRRSLQAMVKNWDADSRPMVQAVAKDLSKRMNKKIEASHPTYGPRLARLNDRYSSLMDAEPMVTEAYKRAGGLESGPMINDRGLPMTKEGIVSQAAKSIFTPRETLMRMMPKTAEQIANDAYLPPGSASPLPDYIPPTPTVSPEDIRALRQPFGQDMDAPVGPGYLPPRTPAGRPALDKAPTYIPGRAKEGLPPRVPQNTRRSFEEKAPTYVREPAEGLPPREPKYPRRALESTQIPDDAFLKVLGEAKGWPPGLNEKKIDQLIKAYHKSKPDAQKSKIMSLLRQEWEKALNTSLKGNP